MKKGKFILETILWILGFTLICLSSWQTALGVFIVIWANNIDRDNS